MPVNFENALAAKERRAQLTNEIEQIDIAIAEYNERAMYADPSDAEVAARNEKLFARLQKSTELREIKTWLERNRTVGEWRLLGRAHVLLTQALATGQPLRPEDVGSLLDEIQATVGAPFLARAHERAASPQRPRLTRDTQRPPPAERTIANLCKRCSYNRAWTVNPR